MRFICVASAHLRWAVFPKILEYSAVDLIGLFAPQGWFLKSTVLERITLTVRYRNSAVAVETRRRCATAEDDGVLPFVNVTLPDVTNCR
jgi:hypothetical protein